MESRVALCPLLWSWSEAAGSCGQAEPNVGMFPGASELVGGAGTWANRTKKRAGMNQGQLKYAEMQFIPLGKNNPKQSYVMGGRDMIGGTKLQGVCRMSE